MQLAQSSNPQVFAYLRQDGKESLLVVVKLSDKPVNDATHSLASGSLKGGYRALNLLGAQKLAGLKANAAGGFDRYVPLPVLEPYQPLVIGVK